MSDPIVVDAINGLCSDCPPRLLVVDHMRCGPCPRRTTVLVKPLPLVANHRVRVSLPGDGPHAPPFPPTTDVPEYWVALGYAHLLRALAGRMRCSSCGKAHRGQDFTDLDVWFHAPNAFKTAEMLAAGENPWAIVEPAVIRTGRR